MYPEDNSLALVYRDKDTLKFIKHINNNSSSHLSSQNTTAFYDFSFNYYEWWEKIRCLTGWLIVCELWNQSALAIHFRSIWVQYTQTWVWYSRGTFIFECASISIPTTKILLHLMLKMKCNQLVVARVNKCLIKNIRIMTFAFIWLCPFCYTIEL